MQPVPAAVIAWRYFLSCTSPAANTPSIDVLVVPGVVISADGRPELVAAIHASGLDFLAKPVKPAALRALMSRHLTLQ